MKTLNKLAKGIFALVLLAGLASCSKVPAGNVGVKVYLLGDSKGVQSEQLGVGRYWIGWNEELYNFPTFTQTYVYTANSDEGKDVDESINFQTVEAVNIKTNVGISYHVDANDAVKVFQKYREDVKEITAGPLRNEVRNAMNDVASTYAVDDLLGKGKVPFMNEVKKRVITDMSKVGVTIEDVYLVGKMTVPANIETAINSKIQAQQDAITAQNKIQQTIAEAKQDSIEATGKAKAQNELKVALTPELLQKMWIDKWDGHLPTYQGTGNASFLQGFNK